MQTNLLENIKQIANKNHEKVKAIREHLHAYPELSFKEFATAKYISEILTEYDIEHTTGIVETGILGLIKGNGTSGKTILLRGDMDALPILEKNNVPYKSTNNGVMHACGHDVHSACLLGALAILNELKNDLPVDVKFMFQPGEEVLPGGASLMIKQGALQNPTVSNAIAQHVFPSMEVGKVGFRKGMYMASTDEIYITVTGKGGHAAMPADYINPLLIASELLTSLHSDFMHTKKYQQLPEFIDAPTVLAFGKIEGMGATNVIPEKVEIAGTFRTMNELWREEAHKHIVISANGIATKWNATIDVRIEKGYPFLVNDDELTSKSIKAAQDYLGEQNVEELPIRMTAEDFAYISQAVPSCFYRLGTGNASKNITSGVHTATFDIDEKALEVGAGLMAWLVFNAV